MNRELQKQKGVALIGVLIIVALITAAYTYLLQKQSYFFTSTKLGIEQSRIFNTFYSMQDLAKDKLLERLTEKDKPYISRKNENGELDKWAIELEFPIDDTYFKGKLVDRSSKLNINQVFVINDNYVGIDATTNFNNCLINLSNDLEVEQITPYIVDYLNQQEQKDYFEDISELKNIDGISSKTYQALTNFLYAGTSRNFKININTASKEMLKCLHSDIDDFAADNIMDNRPITSIGEMKNILYQNIVSIDNKEIDKQILPMVDIRSNLFEMQSTIKSGDSSFDIKSILMYSGGKIRSIYRTFDSNLDNNL